MSTTPIGPAPAQDGGTADSTTDSTTESTPQNDAGQRDADQSDDSLGDPGKAALAAERAARRAADQRAKELAAKLDEIEKSQMSEIDRAKKEAEQAKAELERLAAETLRAKVQARHGITDNDADLFLTGTDEKTLETQARRLAEMTKPTRKTNAGRQPSRDSSRSEELEAVRALFGQQD